MQEFVEEMVMKALEKGKMDTDNSKKTTNQKCLVTMVEINI